MTIGDVEPMIGWLIFIVVWFGMGSFGAYMAHRGSMRDYKQDIYGGWFYAMTILFGFAGMVGSSVAW